MFAAAQITATAIVPIPIDTVNSPKRGPKPYTVLCMAENGSTNANGQGQFAGVTISETEEYSPNKALTVQLSGSAVVRVKDGDSPFFGQVLYAASDGKVSTADAFGVVVCRFLSSLGIVDKSHHANVLLVRAVRLRKDTESTIVYEHELRTGAVGRVVLRSGIDPAPVNQQHFLAARQTTFANCTAHDRALVALAVT